MLHETGNVRNDDTQYVQENKIHVSPRVKNIVELLFDHTSKKVQRQHIKEEVHVVLVDESRGNETEVLVSMSNSIGIENQPSHDILIAEGIQADGHCKTDN